MSVTEETLYKVKENGHRANMAKFFGCHLDRSLHHLYAHSPAPVLSVINHIGTGSLASYEEKSPVLGVGQVGRFVVISGANHDCCEYINT